MAYQESFQSFREKSGVMDYLSEDDVSSASDEDGQHSSHSNAVESSGDDVVTESFFSGKDSMAGSKEEEEQLPFASTPRGGAPKALWADAFSPMARGDVNPDRSRSFIAHSDTELVSPHSSRLANNPNENGRLRDRLARRLISKNHEKQELESRTQHRNVEDLELKASTSSQIVIGSSPSPTSNDVVVLDSDEDKNAKESPKEEKPQPLSVLPEVITLESSDEDKSGPSKAPSSVSPQEVYEIPTEPQEVYEIPTEPIAKFKGESTLSLQEQLRNAQKLLSRGLPLPDGGERLRNQIMDLEMEIARREKHPEEPEPDLIVDKVVDAMNKSLHINAYPEDRRPRSEFKIKTPWSYLIFTFFDLNDVLINAQRPFARAIQEKALQELHKALLSQPEPNQLTETPKGIICPLREHQQSGLTWMLWRESISPRGGILADEMGLGKTLSIISLIVNAKLERRRRRKEGTDEMDRDRRKQIKARGLVPSNATLIVAPAALIYHWEAEINERCEDDLLHTIVYHSASRKRIGIETLKHADVVITTYSTLASEIEGDNKHERVRVRSPSQKTSVLEEIHWARIVLDEAHQIKNKATKSSRAVCRLEADARWCVTGTPLHNNLWDLYSLMRFLKVDQFSEEWYWKEYVVNSSKKSADRLNLLMKTFVLRREKNFISTMSGKQLVELPPKHCEDVFVEFEEDERVAYDIMFAASRQKIQQLLDENQGEELTSFARNRKNPPKPTTPARNPFLMNGASAASTNFGRMGCMLVILLRLRQACVHFHLTKAAMDLEAFQSLDSQTPIANEEDAELANFNIESVVGKDSLSDVTHIFKRKFTSAKIRMVLKLLESILGAKEKCVIVSQWTSFLKLLERHINRNFEDAVCSSITGEVKPSERQERVDAFNKTNAVDIMLISITAGGVGLNLTGGNHLILLDLHWNPALELQASDRVHRIGQTRDVYIHKLIMKNSMEERVLELQKKKMELAGSVLRGAVSKKAMNLTMADLRFLFNLDGPEKAK